MKRRYVAGAIAALFGRQAVAQTGTIIGPESDKPWSCLKCGAQFSDPLQLERHLLIVGGDHQGMSAGCSTAPYCGVEFEPDVCPNPACRTKADPYVRPLVKSGILKAKPCEPEVDPTVVCVESEKGSRQGPIERVTRCKRCNNAFWQDAKA
jgi:hypothetical protein